MAHGQVPAIRETHTPSMNGHCDKVVVTQIDSHPCGGVQIVVARQPDNHPIPEQYTKPAPTAQHFGKPIAVGTVVTRDNKVIPPTSNNRGVSMPPQVKDAKTGQVVSLPPRTNKPAQPNSLNPVYHPAPVTHSGPVNLPTSSSHGSMSSIRLLRRRQRSRRSKATVVTVAAHNGSGNSHPVTPVTPAKPPQQNHTMAVAETVVTAEASVLRRQANLFNVQHRNRQWNVRHLQWSALLLRRSLNVTARLRRITAVVSRSTTTPTNNR